MWQQQRRAALPGETYAIVKEPARPVPGWTKRPSGLCPYARHHHAMAQHPSRCGRMSHPCAAPLWRRGHSVVTARGRRCHSVARAPRGCAAQPAQPARVRPARGRLGRPSRRAGTAPPAAAGMYGLTRIMYAFVRNRRRGPRAPGAPIQAPTRAPSCPLELHRIAAAELHPVLSNHKRTTAKLLISLSYIHPEFPRGNIRVSNRTRIAPMHPPHQHKHRPAIGTATLCLAGRRTRRRRQLRLRKRHRRNRQRSTSLLSSLRRHPLSIRCPFPLPAHVRLSLFVYYFRT